MKMTYTTAIENAISALSCLSDFDAAEIDRDATVERLEALRAQISKRGERSDEAKAKANEKRKEKKAAERSALLAQVMPVLTANLPTTADTAITARELFGACKDKLPSDFSLSRVQYVLLNDMPDVQKIEAKGKPNLYFRKVD